LSGQALDLTVSLRQPVFVPESTRGLKVLELFKKTGIHMALVVDEYGVVQGLVTLNDILVEIVGDVSSADELENPQAVQREDGSWLLDGMLPVDEFLNFSTSTSCVESIEAAIRPGRFCDDAPRSYPHCHRSF